MSAGEGPTVIKINAITVPEDAGDELARRFAARAHAVDDQEGFEGFELLRPTDEPRQRISLPAVARRGVVPEVGRLSRLRPRSRRRRQTLAPWRSGLGRLRAVVLRGGWRLDRRHGRRKRGLSHERAQRAGTMGRSPGPPAAPAASMTVWARAPSSEIRSINAMRT